jgi:nitroreductase
MEQAQWRELVARAVLAPSSHNTQPWRFIVREDALELHADRTRALPVNDPEDRELTISCAAALLNLRAAAAAAGLAAAIEVEPDPASDLLATVRCAPGAGDGELARLAAAIELRHTSREPFAARPLDVALRERLAAAAAADGAALHWIEGRQAREQAADLVAEGDRLQFADRRWRRELAAWMHPSRADDGLPVERFGGAVRFVVSRFNVGGSTAGKDEVFALHAPALGVLSTPGDERGDWMAAGQALERVLLTAAAAGVQAGYLNQPCQVAALRPRLRELAGGEGEPQLVLRLGHSPGEPPRHRRRPVSDVLTFA